MPITDFLVAFNFQSRIYTTGFDVQAVFMKNWDTFDEIGQCNGEKDFADAEWICSRLNVPLLQVNFVKEYWNDVFGYHNSYNQVANLKLNKLCVELYYKQEFSCGLSARANAQSGY